MDETQLELPLFDAEAMVAEFAEKFETSKDPVLWKKLIEEELNEVEGAFAEVLKEYADLAYVIMGGEAVGVKETDMGHLGPRLKHVADLIDGVHTVLGKKVFQTAFTRVHTSNMSKLGADGKPVRREDGKVLKGPNYAPAQLIDLVRP